MAEQELNLDEEGKKSGPSKIIIMIVAVLLLIGGSIGGTLYFSGALEKTDEDEVEKKPLAEISPALYLKLEPEFIVNFSGEQEVSYIQLEIQLMAREQLHLDQAVQNMPAIRHQILLILSGQKYSELRTPVGKDKLRADILSKVQEILGHDLEVPGAKSKEHKTKQDKPIVPISPGIEAVYFTMFIMQ